MPARRSRTLLALLVAGVLALTVAAVPAASASSGRHHTSYAMKNSQRFVHDLINKMTLEEKVGQLFVTYAYGATADTTDLPTWPPTRRSSGSPTARSWSTNITSAASSTSPGPATWPTRRRSPDCPTGCNASRPRSACTSRCSSAPTRSTVSSLASARPPRSCRGTWRSALVAAPVTRTTPGRSAGRNCGPSASTATSPPTLTSMSTRRTRSSACARSARTPRSCRRSCRQTSPATRMPTCPRRPRRRRRGSAPAPTSRRIPRP